jgi:putative nucleotidyltransferase with HDIG domain
MVEAEEAMEEVLEEFRQFLVSYLRDKDSREKRSYPWKESWRFIVAHAYRVEAYTRELIEAEGGVSPSDEILIRAAALMHDIGSLDDRRSHHKVGADIVRKWCRHKPEIRKVIDCKLLAGMIRTHRRKDGREKKLPIAILKDADILDELGAMSVFMMAHQIDPSSYDYYSRILSLLEKDEFAFFKKQQGRLTTSSAKKIMRSKLAFIKEFSSRLRDELKGTDSLEL